MKGNPSSTSGGGAGIPSWLGMASHYVPQSPVFAQSGAAAPTAPPPPIAGGLVGGAGGSMAPSQGAGVSAPMGAAPTMAGGASTQGVMANNTMGMPAPAPGAVSPTGAMSPQGNPAIQNFLSRLPPGLLGALGGAGGGGLPPWLSGLLGGHAGGGMMGGGMAGGNMTPPPGASAPMMSNFARPY